MALKGFKRNFFHGWINVFISCRKNNLTGNHTKEQADNLPLTYVTVMSNACNLFVSLVLSKR